MRIVADQVTLSGATLVWALIVAGYLMVAQPIVGGWSQARFERRVNSHPGARIARYRRTLLSEWALFLVVLVVTVRAPGLDLADLGLRAPGLTGPAAPFTGVGALGLVLSGVLLVGLRRRLRRNNLDLAGPRQVVGLLPRTARERQVFGWVAVTAGVCEEVLYRGFLLAVAAGLAPGLSPWSAVLLAGLAFGVAHAYQGAGGVAVTGVLGSCLTILYLGTGSLLLPVLYHVLIDLRALVLAQAGPRHAVG